MLSILIIWLLCILCGKILGDMFLQQTRLIRNAAVALQDAIICISENSVEALADFGDDFFHSAMDVSNLLITLGDRQDESSLMLQRALKLIDDISLKSIEILNLTIRDVILTLQQNILSKESSHKTMRSKYTLQKYEIALSLIFHSILKWIGLFLSIMIPIQLLLLMNNIQNKYSIILEDSQYLNFFILLEKHFIYFISIYFIPSLICSFIIKLYLYVELRTSTIELKMIIKEYEQRLSAFCCWAQKSVLNSNKSWQTMNFSHVQYCIGNGGKLNSFSQFICYRTGIWEFNTNAWLDDKFIPGYTVGFQVNRRIISFAGGYDTHIRGHSMAIPVKAGDRVEVVALTHDPEPVHYGFNCATEKDSAVGYGEGHGAYFQGRFCGRGIRCNDNVCSDIALI